MVVDYEKRVGNGGAAFYVLSLASRVCPERDIRITYITRKKYVLLAQLLLRAAIKKCSLLRPLVLGGLPVPSTRARTRPLGVLDRSMYF